MVCVLPTMSCVWGGLGPSGRNTQVCGWVKHPWEAPSGTRLGTALYQCQLNHSTESISYTMPKTLQLGPP